MPNKTLSRFTTSICTAIGVGFLFTACAHKPNPWRTVREPLKQKAQVYGTVNAGCLVGAESLIEMPTLEGENAQGSNLPKFEVMRPSRNRFFAHPSLVAYVTALSEKVYRKTKKYLLIGDLAQPRGGPMGDRGAPTAHSSHQTGLDVDVWFESSKYRLALEERENRRARDLVNEDHESMSSYWNLKYQSMVLKTAANFETVDRIFVNPAIKRELCIHSRKSGVRADRENAWLAKVRPWWGHKDHFHVRLKCPLGNAECVPVGDPIPAGDGCDETLNWWFSDEAKQLIAERAATPPEFKMPELPAACEQVLPLLTHH